MKSLPAVALDAVREDIQAAYDYFEVRVSGAGERFLDRYFSTTDTIALNRGVLR